MLVSEFDFDLPAAQIAQAPPAERGTSRLLVLDRATGAIAHRPSPTCRRGCGAGDVLVVNDTRVFPARLLGQRVPERRPGRGVAARAARHDQLGTRSSTPGRSSSRVARRAERRGRRDRRRRRRDPRRDRRPRHASAAAPFASGPDEPATIDTRAIDAHRAHAAAAVHPSAGRRRPIASATRPSMPASAARSRRRPPACTSRRDLLDALDARGRRARGGHAARRLRHVQAGARRGGRGARRRSRALHDRAGRRPRA